MWRVVKNSSLITVCAIALMVLMPRIGYAATTINAAICPPFEGPDITAPNDGLETSENTIHVMGTGESNMSVEIVRNGVVVGSVTSTSDGSFGIEIPIVPGVNVLQAQITNACSTVKKSYIVTVTVPVTSEPNTTSPQPEVPSLADSEQHSTPATTPTASTSAQDKKDAPLLDIASARATNPRLWISGVASPLSIVTITVDGKATANVLTSIKGSFGALVTLKSGENKIQAFIITSNSQKLFSPVSKVIYTPLSGSGAAMTGSIFSGTSINATAVAGTAMITGVVTGLSCFALALHHGFDIAKFGLKGKKLLHR